MKPDSTTTAAKPNPLLEVAITLLVPALILMKLSAPEALGPVNALLLALSLPIAWGTRTLLRERRLNYFALLGIVSLLLTGGIGLLELDPSWLAVKEAAIPGLIGLVVAGSAVSRRPLARVLIYTPALFDVERIAAALDARGSHAEFERRLRIATWMLGGAFFFSSAMNYTLARWIVTSPAGSTAFNEELARLTLLSYPMIALPATVIMMASLFYLARSLRRLAGIGIGEALRSS